MRKSVHNEINRINRQLNSLGLPEARPRVPPFSRLSLPLEDPVMLAGVIEHTLLKPDATHLEIEALCSEACRYGFYGVCVQPVYVEMTNRLLEGMPHKVIVVVGFPHGATLSKVKALETEQVIALGASEVDMVMPIGVLKSGDYTAVFDDISGVVAAAGGKPVIVRTPVDQRGQRSYP